MPDQTAIVIVIRGNKYCSVCKSHVNQQTPDRCPECQCVFVKDESKETQK